MTFQPSNGRLSLIKRQNYTPTNQGRFQLHDTRNEPDVLQFPNCICIFDYDYNNNNNNNYYCCLFSCTPKCYYVNTNLDQVRLF
jgi:hypothetical protein